MSYFGPLGRHVDLLGLGFGDRYSYVPTALFGLALLAIAQTASDWPRRVAALFVVWTICIGINDFTRAWALPTGQHGRWKRRTGGPITHIGCSSGRS
jgi:hypothetical protein